VSETDTSVSGCAFDDGTAGFQETLLFGILNDEEGGAVFDGTAGVLEFGFSKDIAACLFGEFLQADKRGFSNCYGLLIYAQVEGCELYVYHRGSPADQCLAPWRC
jgi:hypothetical protein